MNGGVLSSMNEEGEGLSWVCNISFLDAIDPSQFDNLFSELA